VTNSARFSFSREDDGLQSVLSQPGWDILGFNR
jgi:hypothetical protein